MNEKTSSFTIAFIQIYSISIISRLFVKVSNQAHFQEKIK